MKEYIHFLRYFSHFQSDSQDLCLLYLSVFSSFIYRYILLFLSGLLFNWIFGKLYPLKPLKTNKGFLSTALRKNGSQQDYIEFSKKPPFRYTILKL